MKTLKNVLEGVFDSDLEDQMDRSVLLRHEIPELLKCFLDFGYFPFPKDEIVKETVSTLSKYYKIFDKIDNCLSMTSLKDYELTNKFVKTHGVDIKNNMLVISALDNETREPGRIMILASDDVKIGCWFDKRNDEKLVQVYSPMFYYDVFAKAKTVQTVLTRAIRIGPGMLKSGEIKVNHASLIPRTGDVRKFENQIYT